MGAVLKVQGLWFVQELPTHLLLHLQHLLQVTHTQAHTQLAPHYRYHILDIICAAHCDSFKPTPYLLPLFLDMIEPSETEQKRY